LIEIYQLGIGFVVALSGALIPGPLSVFLLTKTPSYGAKAGPLTALGHILVEGGIIALIFTGLGFILSVWAFQTAVGIIGGILLITFALFTLLKAGRQRSLLVPAQSLGLRTHPVVGGVLFSTALNPSVALWWATVGLAMMMEAYAVSAVLGLSFWVAGHFLADLAWYSGLSQVVWRGRGMLSSLHQPLTLGCAGALFFFGAYFLLKYGAQAVFVL
jgi:threonine/homoserine/homoserine lactone efflux protein